MAFVLVVSVALGQNCINREPATVVYGQLGSFTSTANNGGNSFNSPIGVTVDSASNVYIADWGSSRVLVYAPGSTTAFRVYGQLGSFTSSTANNGGISADSLSFPAAVAVDGAGNVYIADYFNFRVLVYNSNSTTAFRVYGQLGNFTSGDPNKGGISASSLSNPIAVTIDSVGNVYIVDPGNFRVLVYASGSVTAFRVFGHGGGISADSLNRPSSVAVDSANNVYIADSANNRVLVYSSGSATAFRVFGQMGSFLTNIANIRGISADSLNRPSSVAVDSANNVYIADSANNRVLVYSSGSTTAFRVLGQIGSLTSNIANNGGISANSLSLPSGISASAECIADQGNRRVLRYPCYCVANFNSMTGFSPCAPCPAGTDAVASGSVSCRSCASGFFNPAAGQPCQSCPAGSFSDNVQGSLGCTPCPAGTYIASPGGLVSSCIPCPEGTASNAKGASSPAACQPCPAGTAIGIGSTSCLSSSNSTGGLPLGSIIGVSIGAVLVAAVVAIVGGLFIYKRVTARHDDYTEMLTDEKGDGVFYKM
jgi:sugar lactone lactonase YvrE